MTNELIIAGTNPDTAVKGSLIKDKLIDAFDAALAKGDFAGAAALSDALLHREEAERKEKRREEKKVAARKFEQI